MCLSNCAARPWLQFIRTVAMALSAKSSCMFAAPNLRQRLRRNSGGKSFRLKAPICKGKQKLVMLRQVGRESEHGAHVHTWSCSYQFEHRFAPTSGWSSRNKGCGRCMLSQYERFGAQILPCLLSPSALESLWLRLESLYSAKGSIAPPPVCIKRPSEQTYRDRWLDGDGAQPCSSQKHRVRIHCFKHS